MWLGTVLVRNVFTVYSDQALMAVHSRRCAQCECAIETCYCLTEATSALISAVSAARVSATDE